MFVPHRAAVRAIRRGFTLVTMLVCAFAVTTAQAQTPTAIQVDAAANRHPINPFVYGVGFGTPQQLTDLNVPLNRQGGNNTSRYNWQLNADNRGSDFFFESIPFANVPGEVADTFISQSRSVGAAAMITVPLLDWVAKLGANRGKLSSFSISKYGAQQSADWNYFPDAGNGVRVNGVYLQGNDPNDANVKVDATFMQGWIQHIVGKFGKASAGGQRYYILDNEPSIWHSTHRDVHPVGEIGPELLNKYVSYASMIKAVDPGALIVGPEEFGWSGYLHSGYDLQWGATYGWNNLPDRRDNRNGMDHLPWLLDQLRQKSQTAGVRLLDVFTVHYYPQGGEYSDDVSTAMQQRRNRSTRSLWDPNYVDETWVGTQVFLIPRMKGWVASYYPGTQTGVTEYNWGAEGHMNGATCQADVLGIFGREGLDMGARWGVPDSRGPVYTAFKMYRNYDGNKSTFGDTSVSATVPNPDQLSAFAALRSSDNALTIMVINKDLTNSTPISVSLANYTGANKAQTWQLAGGTTINRLGDVTVSGNKLTTTVPAQSVTLFVLGGQGATTPFNSASFVSQSVPTTMTAGQSYNVSVTMLNDSNTTWTAGTAYRLGSQNPQDNATWGSGRVQLPNDVAPGAQVTFNFTAKAPTANGTYNFQWKMVQDGKEWFGAATQNVAVSVSGGSGPPVNGATFVSQTLTTTTTWTAGQVNTVTVKMRNTGNTTWTEGGNYRLGAQNPQDNSTWGFHRVNVVGSVAPGQDATFTFSALAPTKAGTYNFQWRMVQDGKEWFGDFTPNVPITVTGNTTAGTNNAAYVSQSVPTAMTAGQTYPITITMKNTGTTTWLTGGSYRLGAQNPQDNSTWGFHRVDLPNTVAPGAQVTLTFTVTAPTKAGTYNFQWKMVQEWVQWFGAATPNVAVTVQ